jgi:hypothetical protein
MTTTENLQPRRSSWDLVWIECHRCGFRLGVYRGLQPQHQRCSSCRSLRLEVSEAPDLNVVPYRPRKEKEKK